MTGKDGMATATSIAVDTTGASALDKLGLPKGALLYATCSIEHAENGAQVRRLVNRHALSPVLDRTIMPTCLPGEPAATYRDGGFHALLVKA